ncbi:M23 family metallopeptidase [Ekhidna sp.]|uniref:M23 family metallopeptidase n=1 Tax=Ekhidna sp. TaxID=2608089 RepID=UPI003CCBF8BD
MKQLLLALLTITVGHAFAHINAKVYHKEVDDGFIIYARNNEPCAVSVMVSLKLMNMEAEEGKKKVYLVEPLQTDVILTKVFIKERGKSYSMSYNCLINFGDHNLETYDSTYEYQLPFEKGSSYTIHQGYNGSFSHQDKKAVDFTMPEGTKITAIREGVVVKVVENNKKGCDKPKCIDFANYIIVQHPDGTFAEYSHLKKNGALVHVGEYVSQGQVIAQSGNTGWSTGPHLHLEVFLQRMTRRETIKTKFLVGDGQSADYLNEKETYERNY